MQYLIDGYYTVEDQTMYENVALLAQTEDLRIEPSSSTSFEGPFHVLAASEYLERAGLTPEKLAGATHLTWITGGNMVPEKEMDSYIAKGEETL